MAKTSEILRLQIAISGLSHCLIAVAVLTWGLSLNDDDFFETLSSIQRGLDDFEQGKFSSLDDFVAEQNQKYGLALES